MAVIKKMFKKFLGFEDEEVSTDNYFAESMRTGEQQFIPEDKVGYNERRMMEVKLYPKTFGDACEVIEQIEKGNVVIVDLSEVELETSKRITDFVLGALYVMNGDVEKIAKKVFRFWVNY